jgi:hypothetical protein
MLVIKGSAREGQIYWVPLVQKWDLKATSTYAEPRKFLTVHPSKPDGRWTPVAFIAQNRSSVRLHCRIVHLNTRCFYSQQPAGRFLSFRHAALWPGHRAPENSALTYALRTGHPGASCRGAACSPVRGPAWGPRGCFA